MGVQRDVFEATVSNLDGTYSSKTLRSWDQRIASRPILLESALPIKGDRIFVITCSVYAAATSCGCLCE